MLMNTLPLAMGGPVQDGQPWSEAAFWEPVPGSEVPGKVPDDPRSGPTGPFIENLGQWEDHVRYVARTAFGEAVFHRDGVMYSMRGSGGGIGVKVEFDDARSVEPVGMGATGTVYNYLFGNDPAGWVTGALGYRELLYADVWPGVDVRYHVSDGAFKYDVIVGPDTDPSVVRFDVEGGEGLRAGDDRLEILLSGGHSIHDVGLVAWYDDGEAVDVSFCTDGTGYGFDVDKERGRTLVIDPLILPISTFLGGSYEDLGVDLKEDPQGNIYVAGTTVSVDYPVTAGAYSVDYSNIDLVITKMDRNCTQVIWSTFIGGEGEEWLTSIELDEENDIHILGETQSPDFPVTEGALQTTQGGRYSKDLYVLKLTSDGSALDYSTYVGGLYPETAGDIEVHGGRAYIAATTESADFPYGNITAKYYGGIPFLLVLSEDGGRVDSIMSWGGSRTSLASALHVDAGGNATIAGWTGAWDFPTTPGAYMEEGDYNFRSFLLRCDPWANETFFATYFGNGWVAVTDIALDGEGNIYLAGTSLNISAFKGLNTTEGAYRTTYNGRSDVFITKMDPMGTHLIYSTLVGGAADDYAGDLEVTDEGIAVLVGWLRDGADYEVSSTSLDNVSEGVYEGFVFALNEEGSAPVHSTYLGGQFGDYVTAVEITNDDTLLVIGYTESKGFPVTEGAYQTDLAGDRDIFVSELCCLYPPSEPLNLTVTGGEGNINLTWEPPLDDGGYPITRYLVHRGTSGGGLDLLLVVGDETTFRDEEVEYGVYYFYAVSAFNGKGLGPLGNIAMGRSVTVPDAPVNLTGTVRRDHIKLTWETPGFTGGLSLDEYRLYRSVGDGEAEMIATVHAFLTEIVDTEVVDRTIYTYTLVSSNGYGESRSNPSVTLRTTGVPTPPLDLDHTYGEQFIDLTWEEPEDDYDLPVARYYVYRWMVSGTGTPELVGVVSAPDLAFLDSTVEVGVLYRYHIIAENSKGPSEPSGTVDAMTMVRPDPPKEVEAVARELFVRLTWTPPDFDGASPVTGFRVYLGTDPEEARLLGNVNVLGVDEPRLVFLHEVAYNGLVRQYFVTAVNVEGESDPSPVTHTLMYSVPSSPLSLEAEWGDGMLILNWSVPASDGGTPLVTFNLFRSMKGTAGFIELASVPASTLRYVDDTLSNGIEYTYWLTASNLAGESEPSMEVTAMPAGPPLTPEGLVAEGLNGSVRVTWAVPEWNGGRPIIGYRVYGISEGMQAMLLSEQGPDTLEYVQEDLVNGVVYLYAIKAYSEAGESVLSQVVEGTPAGAPSGPQAMLAAWMDGLVYVSWSSPQDDGGAPITGYRIHREDWDAQNWTEVPALGTMFSDYDVEHNWTYNYTLYALNDVGKGPAVRISFTTPPEVESTEEDTFDIWPWLIVAASIAVIAAAIAFWRRPRPLEGPTDDEGE